MHSRAAARPGNRKEIRREEFTGLLGCELTARRTGVGRGTIIARQRMLFQCPLQAGGSVSLAAPIEVSAKSTAKNASIRVKQPGFLALSLQIPDGFAL